MLKIEILDGSSENSTASWSVSGDEPWFMISDGQIQVAQWVIITFLCQTIDIFGITTNIINIIVFVKQGTNDPVNITLIGLAISDLGCLTTLIWTNICYTPAFADIDLPFDPIEFQYLISGMPHVMFTRITGWITAVITLERCLCIAAPLKVKSIVTSKRVSILIAAIFVILMSSVAPLYVANKLDMKYYPKRNKTLLGLVPGSNREEIETVSFAINNVIIPFGAFLVIIICTITLVIKLREKAKWRKSSSSATEKSNVTNRNQKVASLGITHTLPKSYQ